MDALTSRISLQANFYMTREDWVFIVNVVVTNPTWETMVMSVEGERGWIGFGSWCFYCCNYFHLPASRIF